MKLLFLILAHDHPAQLAELARTLVTAASDGVAMIHYDARSPAADHARLRAAVAAEPRIRLVEKRVACRWGAFGLVEAPLNALAQIEAEGIAPDYVILLSGACLPCRPVAALERYLAGNAGREFIEVEDDSWIGDGWRSERWKYRFWFDPKTQHPAEWLFFQIQRRLGLARRFPAGIEPRFGSQWWALTWPTARAILADIRQNPRRLDFFRSVWIPDEMLFQTYVHALVPREAIAGFGLTHFQFTNRGKPVVYHDDHADYVRTLDRFFFRKVSPEARGLRAACLALAGAPDDLADLGRIGARQDHYQLKLAAQTHYPRPGQIFYGDQRTDRDDSVLATMRDPYIVLVGPPGVARLLVNRLPEPPFTRLGQILAPHAVDFGQGRAELGGLRRSDIGIRDRHASLYLARVRARAGGVPVIIWSPTDDHRWLLAAVLRDPAALVIGLPLRSGDPAHDRDELLSRCLRLERTHAAGLPLRVPSEQLQTAAFELGTASGRYLAEWLVSGATSSLAPPDLMLPWSVEATPAIQARRRAELEPALAACRFRDAAWFPALAAAVAEAYDPAAAGRPPAAVSAPADVARAEAVR